MSCRIDLGPHMVNPVRSGVNEIEASRIYQVSRWSVNDWCQWADLSPKSPPDRPREID